MPRLTRLLLPVVLLVALLAGCGGGGAGDENADPAKLAPKTSVVYFTGFVRPEGDDKEAVDSIAKKVLGVDDPGKRIKELITQAFREDDPQSKLTYEDDIEPWLGRRAGVAVSSLSQDNDRSQVALILAATDTDKARDAIDKAADEESPKAPKREYEGTEYRFDSDEKTAVGVVDDYVVIGSEAGLKAAVDASKGDSLQDNDQYEKFSGKADDTLGFGWVDTKSLLSQISASGRLPTGGESLQSLLGTGDQPATLTLDATPKKVTLETVSPTRSGAPEPQQSELLPELPGDSWAALGLSSLGESLKRTLDQLGGGVGAGIIETVNQQLRQAANLDLTRDILPALGDLAVFVRGSGVLTVGGGVVIEPADPKAARRVLDRLPPVIRRAGEGKIRVAPANVDGARGFKVTSSELPGAINAVLKGDRLVIAYTDAATREALDPRERLGDSTEFQQASASLSGAVPALYVAFAPIAELASAASSENAAQIRQYLGSLLSVVAGSRVEGSEQTGRVVLNLK